MSVRVALVDDDADVRRVLRTALHLNKRADIEEAADGVTGMALIDRICPDVVILDVLLPDVSGLEVFDRMIAACPNTRIIIYTGYDRYRSSFADRGAPFVLKDAPLDTVLSLI